MGTMIQIRNVPAELHRKLKLRAIVAGQSLSDYLLAEIRRSAELPSREEMLERLGSLPRYEIRESASQALDAVRRERDAELQQRSSGRGPRRARR